MDKNNICNSVAQLFNEEINQLFKYDLEKNLIYIDQGLKEDRQSHEVLFNELTKITNKLNEIQCDYSVNEQGDILLNCNDIDSGCAIK